MTQLGTGGQPVARLPFQVRPIAGEGSSAFIGRLARANCLPPTYLRRFIAKTPGVRGGTSWERLAAITGRDADQLRKTLDTIRCKECESPFQLNRSYGNLPRYCSTQCRTARVVRSQLMEPCRICQQPMKVQFAQRYRYCSSACRRAAYIERQRRKKDASKEGEPPTCDACEKPLPPNSPTSERTCSNKCKDQVTRWDWMIEDYGLPLPSGTCAFCGSPMARKAPADPYRRWCSRRCRTWASHGHDPITFFNPLICAQCQKPFERHTDGIDRRWCSRTCYRLSRGWSAQPKAKQTSDPSSVSQTEG